MKTLSLYYLTTRSEAELTAVSKKKMEIVLHVALHRKKLVRKPKT